MTAADLGTMCESHIDVVSLAGPPVAPTMCSAPARTNHSVEVALMALIHRVVGRDRGVLIEML